MTMPCFGVYSAAKAGMNMWALSLRAELRGTGVRVANICPGFVTGAGMNENMLRNFKEAGACVPLLRHSVVT